MKIVRVTKGGWGHKFYVYPESFIEKVELFRRGYRKMPALAFLGLDRSWVNNKYQFDYDDGYHWINGGMRVRQAQD